MKSHSLFLLAGLLCWPAVSLSESENWEQIVVSKKNLFRGKLSCDKPPQTGSFQSCKLDLTDQRGNPTRKAIIKLSGGMPAHGHGLPTAPEVVADASPGTYLIKGLRYSMPGAWLIDMKIHVFNVVDQLSYDVYVTYAP